MYGVLRSVPLIVVFWCWDATTQAASEDAPSQRQGWRGLLSFSFEVRACHGRVTLLCKSLQRVSAPNTSSPLRSLRPEYSLSIIQSILHLELHIVGVKTTRVYLSTHGKPVLCYLTFLGPAISAFSLRKLSTSASAVFIPSGGSQVFSSSGQPFHFTQYPSSFLGLFLPRTFPLYEIISLLMILSTFHSKSPSMSSASRRGCSRFGPFEARQGSNWEMCNT